MSNTEVVIHINEELDSGNQRSLSDEVSHLQGVETANLANKCPHLMIVAYNSAQTKSLNVLNGVRNTGVHAQLVGWL
ncbi:MAG: hypothetical protein V3U71_11490 [Cocleimonas sp.]